MVQAHHLTVNVDANSCSFSVHFQVIHGLLDRIMELLEVPHSETEGTKGYYLKSGEGVCSHIHTTCVIRSVLYTYVYYTLYVHTYVYQTLG